MDDSKASAALPASIFRYATRVGPTNDRLHAWDEEIGDRLKIAFSHDPLPLHLVCNGCSCAAAPKYVDHQVARVRSNMDYAFKQLLRFRSIKNRFMRE